MCPKLNMTMPSRSRGVEDGGGAVKKLGRGLPGISYQASHNRSRGLRGAGSLQWSCSPLGVRIHPNAWGFSSQEKAGGKQQRGHFATIPGNSDI